MPSPEGARREGQGEEGVAELSPQGAVRYDSSPQSQPEPLLSGTSNSVTVPRGAPLCKELCDRELTKPRHPPSGVDAAALTEQATRAQEVNDWPSAAELSGCRARFPPPQALRSHLAAVPTSPGSSQG